MTDNDIGAWKSVGNAARKDPALDIPVWRGRGRRAEREGRRDRRA